MLKVSQIAAKVITRVFFILVLVAAVPFMQGDNSKFSHLYFTTTHKWIFVFPIILLLSFVMLLVYSTIKKYKEVDINWLLVLNTTIILIYGITLYVRVLSLVK